MKLKLFLLSILTLSLLAACSQVSPQDNTSQNPITGEPVSNQFTSEPATNNSIQSMENNTAQTASTLDSQLPQPQKGDTVAILVTDFGTIKFKLFSKEVPEMSKNFIELAKAGKFANVPFHRVIKDFMIQSGDFTDKNGRGGYSYKGPDTKLPDEIVPSLHHVYGAVSMANSGPNTNGSQFFIMTARSGVPFLDGHYTIFGQVYQGMDIAEKIADLYIPQSGDAGTPSKIINIKKVTIENIK